MRTDGSKPIVFSTPVNMEVLQVIPDGFQGMLLVMFGTFVHPLETELQLKSNTASAVSAMQGRARRSGRSV